MRSKLPRRPWAHAAWSRQRFWHWSSWVPVPARRRRRKPPPPKVQETVGDLSFVVSRGEWKVEGVGLVCGLDNTGADPPPVLVSQAACRRDDQGRASSTRRNCSRNRSFRW